MGTRDMGLSKRLLVYIVVAIVIVGAVGGTLFYYSMSKSAVQHLRIGYQPSTHQVAHMVAMEKGWWTEDLAKFGVEEITDYSFGSGPPEMQAMLAGDLDFAYVGATPPITAIDKGLDAKIVANAQIQGSHLVLKPDLQFTGPSSLKGLKIATYPPGSIQDTVLKKWLVDNGLDPDVDLDIISMSSPGDAATAMAAGALDGVFLPHPHPAIIELEGNGVMVLASGEMWPQHTCCCLVVSGKLIREQPEIVEQIIKTHIRATQYCIANPDEAAEIFSRKIGLEEEKVLYSIETWDGNWVADPHLGMDVTLEYAKVLHSLGSTEKLLTASELFDTSFYDKIVGR
jgi:NitT/TauT family transport system substrate-binding protein